MLYVIIYRGGEEKQPDRQVNAESSVYIGYTLIIPTVGMYLIGTYLCMGFQNLGHMFPSLIFQLMVN